jgi:hypothetical protein
MACGTLTMEKCNVVFAGIAVVRFRDLATISYFSFFCFWSEELMCEQTVTCEGCGSKWVFYGIVRFVVSFVYVRNFG